MRARKEEEHAVGAQGKVSQELLNGESVGQEEVALEMCLGILSV